MDRNRSECGQQRNAPSAQTKKSPLYFGRGPFLVRFVSFLAAGFHFQTLLFGLHTTNTFFFLVSSKHVGSKHAYTLILFFSARPISPRAHKTSSLFLCSSEN